MTELEPDVPGDCAAALTTLKGLVLEAQERAQRVVNTAMIELYWNIGRTILDRRKNEPWGSRILDRLARNLRAEFPHMKGLSRTNLYNMRAFAAAWNGPELNCPDTVWTIELEPQRRSSVLWVRPSGIAPRRMFLHTDPVDIWPAH